MTECIEAGCDRPPTARGRCGKHYQQWWKANGPREGRRPAIERFWAKVDKHGPVIDVASSEKAA